MCSGFGRGSPSPGAARSAHSKYSAANSSGTDAANFRNAFPMLDISIQSSRSSTDSAAKPECCGCPMPAAQTPSGPASKPQSCCRPGYRARSQLLDPSSANIGKLSLQFSSTCLISSGTVIGTKTVAARIRVLAQTHEAQLPATNPHCRPPAVRRCCTAVRRPCTSSAL